MAKQAERGEPLTNRENQILDMCAEGWSSQEIGDRLFISQRTVGFHLLNAYFKMGVHNRIQALKRMESYVAETGSVTCESKGRTE